MAERAQRELSPDGACLAERDETLSLNGALLLDSLHRCRSGKSLPRLRRAIAKINLRLSDPEGDLLADPRGGQAIEFGKGRLLAELDQISAALTLERAQYYLDRLIKSITEVRTGSINDINLNRWKEYDDIHTDSLWVVDRRDSSGVHTAGYWGNFIPQIPNQMMRRYTKRGEWVIDTFAGSGTTLIEGQRLGRNTVGVELQSRMVERARHLIAGEPNRYGVVADVVNGDSAAADYEAILGRYGRRSAQLVIMHPPYFDIIKFSDDPRDLSNAQSIEGFLEMVGRVVDKVAPVLDKGRYLVLVIGDKYVRGDWVPLGFRAMSEVMERGFSLKSIVVKNFEETSGKRNQKELWRYRALLGGFYIFKHEYIFLFRKQ
jgi:DNA modification methylase